MVRYLTLGNGTKGAFLLCERWSCNEKCHVMFAYNFLLAMNRLANTCDKKVPCLWVWCLDWLNLFFKFIMCREGADMGRWIFFVSNRCIPFCIIQLHLRLSWAQEKCWANGHQVIRIHTLPETKRKSLWKSMGLESATFLFGTFGLFGEFSRPIFKGNLLVLGRVIVSDGEISKIQRSQLG